MPTSFRSLWEDRNLNLMVPINKHRWPNHIDQPFSKVLQYFSTSSHQCLKTLFLQFQWKWSKVKLLSRVWLFVTPWTVAYQAPPSMGFSRREYWSGVPLPSPIKVGIAAKNQLWRATHPNSPDRATGWSVCTEKGLLRNLFWSISTISSLSDSYLGHLGASFTTCYI